MNCWNKLFFITLLIFFSACSTVVTPTTSSKESSNTAVGYATSKGYSEDLYAALFEQGRYDTALKLLSHKDVDINAGDNQGKTLLYEAVRKADIKTMEFLLQQGASPNIMSLFGTPLQFAAQNYQQKTQTTWKHNENKALEVVKLLVENGAIVDLTNEYKHTPLMFAAENNSFLIVEYLLDSGADLGLQDKYHRTALDLVTEKKLFEMKHFLIVHTTT